MYVATHMGSKLGIRIEEGYRKLNSAGSKKPMSLDDWMSIILPLIALSAPRITGIPDSIAIPVTMFVLFVIYTLVRHRADWLKRLAIAAAGCFLLFVVLIFPHHR